jgi:uncharacterized protein YjbI with pentapeptide repeats
MDRDEALRLLRRGPNGVMEWNQWRETSEAIPVLQGADLSGVRLAVANLGGANLSQAHFGGSNLNYANLGMANLSGAWLPKANLDWANLTSANLTMANIREATLVRADLSGTDLSGANLSGADLKWANLSMANLRSADLIGAHLEETDLIGADLSGANLGGANLREARLSEACLYSAVCRGTLFLNIDLSETNGLEFVRHEGPSTIGIDTLSRSGGKLPDVFLRGCGVPNAVIAQQNSLVGLTEPIHFYSCFIIYSTENEDFAKRLHAKMRDEGLRVWFAPADDKNLGKRFHKQIYEQIRVDDKLLLVLSHESMESKWVKIEIPSTRRVEIKEGKRKLFPVRLVDLATIRDWECFDADSGKDLRVEIRKYFIPDFSNWKDHNSFEESFARLLKELKAEESTGLKNE